MNLLLSCILAIMATIPTGSNHYFTRDCAQVSPEIPYVIKGDLAIALVDQGSSRVTHRLLDYKVTDGNLIIHIERNSPFVQTMDFVPTVIYLQDAKIKHARIVHVHVTDRMENGIT